jgi:RNA polymerase sigma factor (sigma-70 family)
MSRGKKRRLTKRQKAIAEEAIDIIPHAIRGFKRAYPGIEHKLARIDSVSVAHVAIVMAARTYDAKKSKLTTYFTRAIHNWLLKEIDREKRLRYGSADRIPLALVESELDAEQWKEDLANAMLSLTDDQRKLVRARFFSAKTFEEMAKDFDCDRRTVRRRLMDVLSFLESLESPLDDSSESI